MSSNVSTSEAQFFDGYVKEKGDFNPFADRGWRTLQTRFEEALGQRRDVELLDVGCGTGQSRRIYEDRVGRYVGIDLSQEAIDVAREKYPQGTWQVADACEMPFDDASFDVVTFSSVLHHIPDFVRPLREARRVVRPGGLVFAFDPNLRHPAMFLFRNPRSPLYLAAGVSPNERPLWPAELRAEFERAGLVEIHQRCQADIPYRSVAPKLINACLNAYNVGDWLMERVGLGRILGSFVITSARSPHR